MARETWVAVLVGLGAGAYCVHGLVTDTGLAGWLEYLQLAAFGSYSMKLTASALMVVVFALSLGAGYLASFGSRGEPTEVARAPLPVSKGSQSPSWSAISALCGAMLAATWIIGYAAYWWDSRVDREDAQARYEPIAPAAAAPLPRPTGSHVALRGRLWWAMV